MKKIMQFIVLMILIASCQDSKQKMVTKINADGTCSRAFTANADTLFLLGDTAKNPFPVKLDSSWKISWRYSRLSGYTKESNQWPIKKWMSGKDIDNKGNFIEAKAMKEFNSVQDMNNHFRFSHSEWNNIKPHMELVKKFRWFFTYYDYKEVYPKYNPTKLVPVSKYLTNEEISMFFGDNPKFPPSLNGSEIKELLDGIDKKKEEWLAREVYEDYYALICKNLKLLKGFEIDSTTFMAHKDTVIKSIDSSKDPGSQLVGKLDKHFKTDAFSRLEKEESVKLDSKDNIIGLMIKPFFAELSYALMMPGSLVETNSKDINGNVLTWKVDANRFFFTDYTIYAESRVVNLWSFIVSGLFVIGVGLSFFVRKKG